ncbi:MAG: glycosyltransferase family 4 protein, partial [Bacteroidales bacterium]|nr:glycosyltransferase family 4 protein [Bacteroidales bacterium]
YKSNKCIIKQFCVIPPPYGGITVYVKQLIDQLNKDGISTGGFYIPQDSKVGDQGERAYPLLDEFPMSRAKNPVRKILQRIDRDLKLLKIMAKYKIVHYHGLENFYFLWILQHILRKEIVITVHSAMIRDFLKRTSPVNRFFIKRMANSDAQWIAVSSQAQSEMMGCNLRFKHTVPVIPAYIPKDTSQLKPLSNGLQQYIRTHSKIVSFYARSFMLYKGTDVYGIDDALILFKDMFALDKSIGFIFCLSEDTDTEKIIKLHDRAKDLGIEDVVFWQIGAIDNIAMLWEETDVYIRPTATDGDSVAVREVMDSGATVIASDVCPRPDGVITYQWKNREEFADKVIIELKSTKRRKPQKDYTHYQSIISIYHQLLNNK